MFLPLTIITISSLAELPFVSLVTTLFSFICTTPSIPRSFKKMQHYNNQ